MSHVVATLPVGEATPRPRRIDRWEWWGRALVLPYLLVFAIFVLYPVGYGLWLARHPQSYERLFDDPIFLRTAINTIVFIVVAINLKMVVAMVLSGFFVQNRGNDVAERYILHNAIESYRAALAYQEHCTAIGHEPLTEEEFARIKANRDALKARFGD